MLRRIARSHPTPAVGDSDQGQRACVPAKGADVTITTVGNSTASGELLEAKEDRLVILVADTGVVTISAQQIRRAEVNLYSNGEAVALLTIWAVLGTASSLSHGEYFYISGPSWALVSNAAIIPVAADPGRFVTVEGHLGDLYEYARFPGGLPGAYDLHRIPLHHGVRAGCDG